MILKSGSVLIIKGELELLSTKEMKEDAIMKLDSIIF